MTVTLRQPAVSTLQVEHKSGVGHKPDRIADFSAGAAQRVRRARN